VRIILDLSEDTIRNLEGYAEIRGVSINDIVEKLFNICIQTPSDIIDKYGAEKVDRFGILLTKYLNETIWDMESMIGTSEENSDDRAMIEVFKELNRSSVMNSTVFTELLEVYFKFEENDK